VPQERMDRNSKAGKGIASCFSAKYPVMGADTKCETTDLGCIFLSGTFAPCRYWMVNWYPKPSGTD